MNLTEKYHYRSKTSKVNLLFYLFIISLILITTTTFSSYKGESDSNAVLKIAKWNVSVNNQSITGSTANISNITLVKEAGSSSGSKIRNGDTGYFDIVIDPTGTEVGVEYIITLSCAKVPSSILSNMEFEYYSLNGESEKHAISSNTIDGTTSDKAMLLGARSALTSSDIKTYRIYWRWVSGEFGIGSGTCSINANVEVRQRV